MSVPMLWLAGCGSSPPRTAPAAQETEPSAPVPEQANRDFQEALTLMRAGNLDQAVAAFNNLAAAYPHYSGPHVNLGIIYLHANRLEEAQVALQEAVRRNPQSAAAHNQLGILYRKQGRFSDAEQAYKQAIAADPDYAIAHLNLGVLNDLYLQQPAEALRSYERFQALRAEKGIEVSQPVDKWITELKRRLGPDPQTARVSE